MQADANPESTSPLPAAAPLEPGRKPPLKQRIQALMLEYGSLALWVYFGIFALVLGGFAFAIAAGAQVESAAGTAGTWAAAYVATKVTQPLRIAATLVVTPFVMRILQWLKGRQPEQPQGPASRDDGSA